MPPGHSLLSFHAIRIGAIRSDAIDGSALLAQGLFEQGARGVGHAGPVAAVDQVLRQRIRIQPDELRAGRQIRLTSNSRVRRVAVSTLT